MMKVKKFEAGKWYRWVGKKERPNKWANSGKMDFMLDGKPHYCREVSNFNPLCATFKDDYTEWVWYDDNNDIELVKFDKVRLVDERCILGFDDVYITGSLNKGMEYRFTEDESGDKLAYIIGECHYLRSAFEPVINELGLGDE